MRRHPTVLTHADAPPSPLSDPGRRRVLKMMAASAALAGTGCTQAPHEKIMPYVNMPEGIVPGDPVFYTSTLLRGGRGVGVLVETESGRPIKIEGNLAHPASLGAADAPSQAAILTLWDPERSHAVMRGRQPSTWEALLDALSQRLQLEAQTGGQGLRLLTGPVSSPTLLSQIGELLARFPGAQWHMHDPADSGTRAAAAHQVFGRPARSLYRLDRARVVLSVDAELFGPSADGARNAHDFMITRRQTPRARLYAMESSPTLCGAMADSRFALPPASMETVLDGIAARLSEGEAQPGEPAWTDRLYRRLVAAGGECLVAPGPSLSQRAHVLAWRINILLGNLGRTVFALEQEAADPITDIAGANMPGDRRSHPSNLATLVDAMRGGQVNTLIMLDVNPAYDAPGALAFQEALSQVSQSVHMGLYRDETAQHATWHIPKTHELEAWSDARGHDGTPSIVQPVIAPLYGGRSPHELMNVLATGLTTTPHQRVRATWRAQWREPNEPAFERRWRNALSRGVIDDTPDLQTLAPLEPAFDARVPSVRNESTKPAHDDTAAPGKPSEGASAHGKNLVAVLANDSNLASGDLANNAWLQELPRPFTKITWDNAALISPATAREHALQSGDIVSLRAEDANIRVLAPVWVLPGQADGLVTLALGYGRTYECSTASGVGFDAYVFQDVRDGIPLRTRSITISRTDRHHPFACTQHELNAHGREPARVKQLSRHDDAPDTSAPNAPDPHRPATHGAEGKTPSLYPDHEYNGYAWGMTVNLDACIGCNACVVACQAENNIPVVGPEQVAMGREMHWLRVDTYHDDAADRRLFQPMACQHCENAPCEVVCPVGATMHDSEGLNVQVYNRCVGTRFCSNNCPYKVRHFNFFQFSRSDPSAAAHANPDVTVRQRGVMEKCTYCVQRISHARIQAQKAGRPIQDGEVMTACQATCPTGAIVFGDINDPDSQVSRLRAASKHYAVLEELNTKPRTTYLARIDNPAARLEDDDEPA